MKDNKTENTSKQSKNPGVVVGTDKVRLFYFDQNRRVYEMNGVKKNSPFQEGYYIEINIISETEKEFICEYGTINKKTMKYSSGRSKYKVFTEQEKDDDVYIKENRHLISEQVRTLSADKLRQVEAILNES